MGIASSWVVLGDLMVQRSGLERNGHQSAHDVLVVDQYPFASVRACCHTGSRRQSSDKKQDFDSLLHYVQLTFQQVNLQAQDLQRPAKLPLLGADSAYLMNTTHLRKADDLC